MATGAAALFPVFVCSSLDTKLALPVSSDDTILSLKRKFEQVHAETFPQIGEIIAKSAQIKKGEDVYHLPDCMSVKMAFHGLEGWYLLLMDAVIAPKLNTRKMQDIEPNDVNSLIQYQDTEKACEIRTNGPVVGVIEPHNQPGSEQTADRRETNQGLEKNINTMKGSTKKGQTTGIGSSQREKKRNMSLKEITEPSLCSRESTPNKRQKLQIEGPSNDRKNEVSPFRENDALTGGDNVKKNNTSSELENAIEVSMRDSLMMKGIPGDTTFSAQYGDMPTETPHLILSLLEKGRLRPEKDAISDEGTTPDNQLATEQTIEADGMSKESASKNARRDTPVSGEPGENFSLSSNDRDLKENSLDEINFSSQIQVKEKASVPPNEFEEQVSHV